MSAAVEGRYRAQTFELYLLAEGAASGRAELMPAKSGSADRPAIPVATLLLVALTLVVRFVLQAADADVERTTAAHYLDGGLAAIELPHYRAWLERRADEDVHEQGRARDLDRLSAAAQAQQLDADYAFLAELRANRVIQPGDPRFGAWRTERDQIDAELDHAAIERYQLLRARAGEAWRFITHAFLHSGAAACLIDVLLLLLAGPLAEAAFGRGRFLLIAAGATIAAGLVHVLLSQDPLIGPGAPLAAMIGAVVLANGLGPIAPFGWLRWRGAGSLTRLSNLSVAAPVLLLAWAAAEATLIGLGQAARFPLVAGLVAGLAVGLGAAAYWGARRPRQTPVAGARTLGGLVDLRRAAEDAAARLDVKRAGGLYRDLVRRQPQDVSIRVAYLNVALLGRDAEVLRDAALRILAARKRPVPSDLRRAYLQLCQPTALATLEVKHQLRLARRLVRAREDSAALKLLDSLVERVEIREKNGRALADCLLGLFTTYQHDGRQLQADAIKARLERYFEAGLPPEVRAPAPEAESNTVWAPPPEADPEAAAPAPPPAPTSRRRRIR